MDMDMDMDVEITQHRRPAFFSPGYAGRSVAQLLPEHPSPPDTPRQNHLLAALPDDEYQRLLPHLVAVELPKGHVICQSGCRLSSVYFPTDSVISLQYDTEDGAAVEISVVGNEGMIGIALFMGGDSTPDRAVVQSPGRAYRLDGARLKDEFSRGDVLNDSLLRYAHAVITQMAHAAVCNRKHSVEQRLCRRLLLSLDRLPSNELVMTQELIADMLGVRREAVTEAAGKLQLSGMISYRRGHITVLDRPGLEHSACECYALVKREFDRLLPKASSTRTQRLASPTHSIQG